MDGTPRNPTLFGRFEPKDVFVWYDGPRTFTLNDAAGGVCLAHWLDEDAVSIRFLVAPITPKHLERLQAGELGLRECLDQPSVYAVDVGGDWAVRNVWLTLLAAIPADALPVAGTMIRREVEPARGAVRGPRE